jgi:hypothetical protein
VQTVLVLASSPTDQGPLRLQKEEKVIRNSLNSAVNREQFRLVTNPAATVDDLRQSLLNHTPTVVHFSGHGGGKTGLCFEDEQGFTHPVNGDRLAKLFHLVQEDVKCVVLNACFSEEQARAVSQHIDFVIGMKDEIGDPAAIKFAQGFYEAIWAGQSFEKAFKFGCSAIDTANIPEENVPVILKSPRLGGLRLTYSEETQTIENWILQYLNSGDDDRARMTTLGNDNKKKIDATRKHTPPRKWSSVSVLSIAEDVDGFKAVQAIIRSGLESGEQIFYLKPAGDSYLLDWEATACWWPVPLKTFKALWPKQPMRVRVLAELSDYFNCGHEPREFYSIRMYHLYDGYIHGYIGKRNPHCGRLVRLLYDGYQHRIALEIVAVKDPSHVQITELVSESWVVPDEGDSRETPALPAPPRNGAAPA